MNFRFVKYACGCIGFPPLAPLVEDAEREATSTQTFVVKDCSEGDITLMWRTLDYHRWTDVFSDGTPISHTRSVELSQDETNEILAEIRSLMHDGDRLRNIQSLLGVKL